MKKRIIGILIILVCLGVIFAFTNKSHTFTGTLTRNGTEEKASATLQYKRYMDWFSQGNKKIKGTLTINLSGGESVIVHELETILLQPGTMEFRFGSYYAYDRERNVCIDECKSRISFSDYGW